MREQELKLEKVKKSCNTARKVAKGFMILGGVWMLGIAASIITSMAVYLPSTVTELPMVALATTISPFLGTVYGILLILGMLCNGFACFLTGMSFLELKFPLFANRRKLSLAIAVLIIWGSSLLGFGDLIGVVYPVFGYCGVIFLLLITVHYFRCLRNEKQIKRIKK